MKNIYLNFLAVIFLALFMVSCGGGDKGNSLSGEIQIDGSSTVFPITEAVSEEFRRDHRDVRVTIGVSGTGGGFKKFCRGEIDMANASREIKGGEIEDCKNQGIEYLQLSVAYDGIAVVVNPENDWMNEITIGELKKIWEPSAQDNITRWSQIREGWPDEKINLYGPGVASGTFDYFTEAIVGESGKSRGDFTASEDDNVLVQGVSSDKYGLGFFGIAYFEENSDKLKLIKVDNGNGPVKPSLETIKSGEYAPLSRPLFIYVRKDAAQNPAFREFAHFYIENAGLLANEVGFIPLKDQEYQEQLEKFNSFAGIEKTEVPQTEPE